MKSYALLATAGAALLSGCVVLAPGHLYPVQGPLAAQNPAPIYRLRISGVLDSGTMSADLAAGESCSGRWSRVSQNDQTATNMSADWDQVYGAGFFTANVLGGPAFAQANLKCSGGSALEVQFYLQVPGNLNSARGVAQDGNGNLYKLTF